MRQRRRGKTQTQAQCQQSPQTTGAHKQPCMQSAALHGLTSAQTSQGSLPSKHSITLFFLQHALQKSTQPKISQVNRRVTMHLKHQIFCSHKKQKYVSMHGASSNATSSLPSPSHSQNQSSKQPAPIPIPKPRSSIGNLSKA